VIEDVVDLSLDVMQGLLHGITEFALLFHGVPFVVWLGSPHFMRVSDANGRSEWLGPNVSGVSRGRLGLQRFVGHAKPPSR
jgi:hypothetical protein